MDGMYIPVCDGQYSCPAEALEKNTLQLKRNNPTDKCNVHYKGKHVNMVMVM